MREQLSDFDADIIVGGKYKMNGNNGKLLFTTDKYIYQLKGIDPLQAQAYMNGFIGQFSTDEEFNNACIQGLTEKGWIETIGVRTGW